MDSCDLVCIPPDEVPRVWPHVCHLIEAGYAANGELVPDLTEDFANARCLLWIAWADEKKIIAALTTRLVKYRDGLVCLMVACGGGSLARWSRFHEAIERYAKAEGCIAVRIDGRAGWARVLPGYRRVAVTLEKKV